MQKTYCHICNRLLSVCLLCGVLSGCLFSKSPVTQWYVLPTPEKATPVQHNIQLDGPRIAVGPVMLPGYLAQPGIFIRPNADSPAPRISSVAQWGESLETGIARVLSMSMGKELLQQRISVFPLDFALPADWRIFINIIRLDGSPEGTVVLDATWSFVDRHGKVGRTGQYTDSATAGPGIAGLVAAQGQLLQTFGSTLADEARTIVK